MVTGGGLGFVGPLAPPSVLSHIAGKGSPGLSRSHGAGGDSGAVSHRDTHGARRAACPVWRFSPERWTLQGISVPGGPDNEKCSSVDPETPRGPRVCRVDDPDCQGQPLKVTLGLPWGPHCGSYERTVFTVASVRRRSSLREGPGGTPGLTAEV